MQEARHLYYLMSEGGRLLCGTDWDRVLLVLLIRNVHMFIQCCITF